MSSHGTAYTTDHLLSTDCVDGIQAAWSMIDRRLLVMSCCRGIQMQPCRREVHNRAACQWRCCLAMSAYASIANSTAQQPSRRCYRYTLSCPSLLSKETARTCISACNRTKYGVVSHPEDSRGTGIHVHWYDMYPVFLVIFMYTSS